MTLTAWLTFFLVAGFVWGGFAALLTRAIRAERGKGERHPGASP